KKDWSTGNEAIIICVDKRRILEHAFTKNETWYWALIFTFPVFTGATIYYKRSRKVKIKHCAYQYKTLILQIIINRVRQGHRL
ncbi:MAG: hypothetical protein ABI091_23250, partial [Ferruginibacter sp.]